MRGSTRGSSRTGRIIVADTGAFLTGFTLYSGAPIATPPSVIEEVRDPESRERLELVKASGSLLVVEPPRAYVERVVEEARLAGLSGRLSRADIEVIAVALHLGERGRVTLATDDSAVRRLALRLGIEVASIRYKSRRSRGS